MKQLPLLTLALSLTGCSTFQGQPEEPLIGSLKYQPVVVEKRPVQALSREEVADNYRKLLELRPEQRMNSEATRRLADLELDDSETRLLEQPESQPSDATQAASLNSIALYESLLAGDPNYPNRDLVLYQLSRAYELTGEQQKMIAALDRLISDYPQSIHWSEAQFRRGERFFVLQQFDAAEAAYQAILNRSQTSPYFDRALFKHGWTRFKQRRIEAGLDSFTLLLDRKLNDLPVLEAHRLSPADQGLLKETVRVMSLTFSELGGAKRIRRYFAEHGHRDYEFMLYRGLGDLYRTQERIGDAAEAYLAFVEMNPAHPQAPRLAVDVIDLYGAHKFSAKALESKKSFSKRYQVDGQYWNQINREDRQWLSARLRGYLKELAEYHHALAQQAGKEKGAKAAGEQSAQGTEAIFWYRRYLDSFPGEATSGGISFLLAELLFELDRHREAVDAYENSAYRYPQHGKNAEAGYAALLAYAAAEQQLPESARQAWRRKGIDSALRFADSFPQDPHRAAVLTQAAEQLLAMNELNLASKTAQQVTSLQPAANSDLQRTAWTVAAHSAFEMLHFGDAELAYQRALALLPAQDRSNTLNELQERLAASIYQGAAGLRDQGQQREAAEQFLRVGQLTPRASIRATAEFDAAASLIAITEWQGAIAILEGLRTRSPTSSLLPAINSKLAIAYLQTEQPLKAAAEFDLIAVKGDSPEVRREAGWQAAELYAQAQQPAQAIHAYERYVSAFPQPLEPSIEARQKLVGLHESQHQQKQRDFWLRDIVKADAVAGKARTDRTRFLAAHAELRLAQPAYDRFQGIQLKAPLKKNLKLKKQQMQSAIAGYNKAAGYGVAEVTTAATFRIGELYQLFGKALMESERPKGLNEEELEQYEILLEEQAFPFEDKAIALHETNIRRASQGLYDEWIKKSFTALASLLPVRYAKQEKTETLVDAIN